jgi:hypothetical protein
MYFEYWISHYILLLVTETISREFSHIDTAIQVGALRSTGQANTRSSERGEA